MTVNTVIFDIDGTLADLTHRRHHVQTKPKRWDKFFETLHLDPPVENIVALFQHLVRSGTDYYGEEPCLRFVFCTGRGEEYREVTHDWLTKHVTPYSGVKIDLRMRPAKDSRPDDIIKQEMLDQLRAEGHTFLFAIDDRQRVVDMWRKNGITVLQCAPGDFDNAEMVSYEPKDQETLLTLMVGPSGAGKSSYLDLQFRKGLWNPGDIISSDRTREQMCGDFRDQSQNARVFGFIHEAVRARMKYGMQTVVDATHLKKADRLATAKLAPEGSTVEYYVVNRPLAEKLATGGWRLDVKFEDGKNLVERHDQAFRSAIKDILTGDGLSNVKVVDLRSH